MGLVKLIIILSGFSLMIYGFITLVRNIIAKYKEKISDEDGKPNFVIKKDILDAVKLLFGAQVLCLLFYITPVINENIKIVLSLILTLGSFVGTFLIKERKGYNSLCRGLIFVGQEFFGITMLLMMINKGMGYSVPVIFALWTVFNFYIMKQFGKLENKIFFWITLVVLICSLIATHVSDISSIVTVVVIAAILLLIHIFNKKETIGISVLSNVLFVLLFLVSIFAVRETVENPLVMFIITMVFVLGMLIARIIDKDLTPKALLLYVPWGVMVLLVEDFESCAILASLFNIMVAALIASPSSICKKVLSFIILSFLTIFVEEMATVDAIVSCLIYVCSIFLVYASLLTPSNKVDVEEGGDENEE